MFVRWIKLSLHGHPPLSIGEQVKLGGGPYMRIKSLKRIEDAEGKPCTMVELSPYQVRAEKGPGGDI